MTLRKLLALTALAAPLVALAVPAGAGGFAAPAPQSAAADGPQLAWHDRPGHRYRPYAPRPAYCVAAAFRDFGRGPIIRGSRVSAEDRNPGRACERALRRCWRELRHLPHGPRAQCQVLRSW